MLGLAVPITPPALSAEPPFDAAIGARDASDVLADPFFKNRKPSRSSIIANRPLNEGGDAGEASADMFAHLRWGKGEAALFGHLAAHAFDFALLKNSYRATWDLDGAVLDGGIAHFDKPLGAAMEGVLHSQDGQNETEQPDHSASLGDSIAPSRQIGFSVHTGIYYQHSAHHDRRRFEAARRRQKPLMPYE